MEERECKPEELRVLDLLGQAWNEFVALPEEHSADRVEFMQAIHAAQNVVLARIGNRVVKRERSS